MNKKLAGLVAVGAFAVTGLAGTTDAGAVTPAAAPCTIDTYGHVQLVDWLKVHTSPGITTPAVGQLKDGATFHHCTSDVKIVGGRGWVYGYGYNGSTKVTGWVDGDYITGP